MIEGAAAKTVLIRATGPALAGFGISNGLADPVLRMYDGTGALVASNSAWGGTAALKAAFISVGAFALQNDNSKDAALLLTLNPGTYSFTVTSAGGGSGSVIVEIYDTDTTSRLVYLAARGRVSTGLTVGVVVSGSSAGTFLMRALGPALASAGVSGAMTDPRMSVFNGSTSTSSNDNWGGSTALSDAAATAGLMPLATTSTDSALLMTLSPGAYTAQVAGAGGASGIAMVEVAQIDSNRAATFAPALLIPPSPANVGVGVPVTFAAPAIGRPAPTFQWRKNGTDIPGATRSSYAPNPTVQAGDDGSYTVAMTNTAGTTVSAPFVLTVIARPAFTTQPSPQTVPIGGTATFTAAATGGQIEYQWLRNGVVIDGARAATLTLSNVQASAAGSYSVRISNIMGTVTSNAVALTVFNPRLDIVAQPAAQTVNSGDSATFTVVAIGDAPLRYQWLYNGAIIGGATDATFARSPALTSVAGSYSVVVSNGTGSITSNAAALTIRPRPLAGVYFGTFPNGAQSAGTFALLVRTDGTGAFLGFLQSSRQALIARDVRVESDRSFHFTAATLGGSGLLEYRIEGAISVDGLLAGTLSDISLAMNAAAPRAAATSAPGAGFYQGGVAGSSAVTYLIVSAGGEAYAITASGATADAGRGTISAAGALDIATDSGRITGGVEGAVATMTLATTAGTTTFAAANNDARTDVEKLVNVSTRSQTGSGADALIAGFVISGDQPKQVLIRGVGPTLGSFGVGNALSAARLEIFRGSTLVAQGGDWGTNPNAAAIVAAAARVNAFALPANSRDAAMLLTLQPGAYSAVVSGQDGATGIALAEVYDASTGTIPPGQRIVNIATRSFAGSGDRTLIAGFVVTGTVPKRVLIRGVGPTLASFGVSGVLARPQLTVFSGGTALAQNAGWSQSVDALAIAAAGRQAGAFVLNAGSNDAALILNLAPGAYSAQLSGVGAETGAALVEVYELP